MGLLTHIARNNTVDEYLFPIHAKRFYFLRRSSGLETTLKCNVTAAAIKTASNKTSSVTAVMNHLKGGLLRSHLKC